MADINHDAQNLDQHGKIKERVKQGNREDSCYAAGFVRSTGKEATSEAPLQAQYCRLLYRYSRRIDWPGPALCWRPTAHTCVQRSLVVDCTGQPASIRLFRGR